jgi:uncharacterized protein YigE (DUF2233 family)
MRFLLGALAALSLSACLSAKPIPPKRSASPAPKALRVPETAPVPLPSTPAAPPKVATREIAGITFEGVAFDSRSHRLVVADQPNGPGSRYADSTTAGEARGGIAAINAGFFTPEGAPLGLVMSSGKISGSWNSASSLGSGAWFENPSGKMGITRREKLGRAGATSMRELIQAGPLLVENGRAVGGLEATKVSARTVIWSDGGTHWWIGRSSPCTLAALAQALAAWPARHALNLDGGRSSELWISEKLAGSAIFRRPPWNRPVRNFLVLVAK